MGSDRVASEQTPSPKKSVHVHFAETPEKISLDQFLVKHLGNFGRCSNSTTSENCTKVRYSAVDRWDLHGDRSWIKATVQSLYYIGQMIGSLFCGIMSDKIGRKKVFYIAILIQISCGVLLSVAPTWWIFAILKCGTGFSHPGIYTVCIVLGTELLGTKYRKLASVGGGTFGAIGEVGAGEHTMASGQRPLRGSP
ncbi:hypothetical protein ANCDUO_23157 [Ancylostoma duodenale]|uniref:Major facilitator superfamily (MFS) profile domain-containing protein n=1 Tax=Ancylostoma duodenale TaxID=51022 RepID=A0A0C2BSE1_9BILA|nr:hypothetical protein ANCDUO_23157 [Ancylostoma duodenale]